MTQLYLIRHGEATSQVQDILRDDGLTPLGVMQAERLRDRLAATGEIAADVLIASSLPRARQTAEIIAPALGLPIVLDDELQEMRIGEAEGMHIGEFKATFGASGFEKNPFQSIAPSGEYWSQFTLRVATAIDRIVHQYEGKTIAVVCHGGVIDSSFLYFFNLGTFAFPRTHFFTTNTSLTYWRKEVFEARSSLWRLVYYNDDLHVRDIDEPQRIPWELLRLPMKRTPRQPSMPPPEQ